MIKKINLSDYDEKELLRIHNISKERAAIRKRFISAQVLKLSLYCFQYID